MYNTLARAKEEFIPIEENRVSVYSCGPTLCQFVNVGECRRFLLVDLLRRYLEFRGFEVHLVMNITDLDDRTIEGAEKSGMSLGAFTGQYEKAFLEDLKTLRIKPATVYPKASEHVEDMIRLTQSLMEKGYAYEKFRSIYFDISRVKGYGRLSRIDLDKIRVGKTVDLDQYEKENPRDFTLLKRSTLNELKRGIFYKTRWGNLRPSWHMECSAMAMKYLPTPYDIHTSGLNLIFPHHENAVAIGQALSGQPPARYWLHNELVTANGGDGAGNSAGKSGNGLPALRDILERGFSGREVRYWLLSRHYRKPIHFSWAKLQGAKNTLAHLDRFVQKIRSCQAGPSLTEADQLIYDLRHGFIEALNDDLNMAPALAALFQFTRKVNRVMDRKGLCDPDRQKLLDALGKINVVLGFLDLESSEVDRQALDLIAARETARQEKDWPLADRLRTQLRELGVEVTDTRQGPVWRLVS